MSVWCDGSIGCLHAQRSERFFPLFIDVSVNNGLQFCDELVAHALRARKHLVAGGVSEGEVEGVSEVEVEGVSEVEVEGGSEVVVGGGSEVEVEGGCEVEVEGGSEVGLEGGCEVVVRRGQG